MAAPRYRKFMKLLGHWCVDKDKVGRDLGSFIRSQLAVEFKLGEATQLANETECDEKYESLRKISSNFYKNAYTRAKEYGSTGLDYETCKGITSNEVMIELTTKSAEDISK
ncbi:ubiquinol-cytochrome c reductase complex assembly factor 2-like [Tubulanus polymorphus]|uniref:ubiquinol-cytochrome c reductase complex assembly factor 2-like n=1 Tax=Tubulanus polymorphus TaxID=672921 RepID=UPI003DA3E20F